jgi:AcrR family transcriptional regulator
VNKNIICCSFSAILNKGEWKMKQRKTDHRIKYTKDILRKSLLDLMEKQSIEKITVTDLCNRAEINRGTFYKYYANPHDLLSEIQNDLYKKISKAIENNQLKKALKTEMLSVVYENRDLFRILFSENGDKEFLQKIINMDYENNVNMLKKNCRMDDMHIRAIYTFISSGMAGLVQLWISGGLNITPDEMGEFITKTDQILIKGYS